MRRPPSKLVLPWHEPLPLSKSACVGGWRFMEKWFSGSAFAAARDARRCSGFVRTAIADSAIAARLAAPKPGASNTGLPTAAISGVRKAGSTIGTGNVQYRERHCRPRVTDQSSHSVISPAPFGCGETITTPVAVALRVAVSRPAGKASRSLAALLDLWPARPLRRSFPTHSTTKVSLDDQLPKPAYRFAAISTPSIGKSARLHKP